MIHTAELMIGSWVMERASRRALRLSGLERPGMTDYIGIPLDRDMFIRNGWRDRDGVLVMDLDRKYRLGWDAATHKFYMGYGELPRTVDFVHELQLLFNAMGLHQFADTWEISL